MSNFNCFIKNLRNDLTTHEQIYKIANNFNYTRFTFPAPPCTLAVSQTLHPKQTVPAHEINGLHINKAPKNLIDSVTIVTQSSI